MMTNAHTADALVIGGGIHGCSAALHLSRRGLKVTLLEKDHVARHASGVNAGGVRRLGRDVAEVPIAQAAWELWQDMPALVDDDCGYRRSRNIKVARTEDELDTARKRVAELNALGFTHEDIIDRDTLREILPACADHCVGALHVDGDGSALPFNTTQAFRRRAEALGARVVEGAPVTKVVRQSDTWRVTTPAATYEAPLLINAAGAWGGELARQLGDEVPLQAHAPMLVITARMPRFVEAVVGALGGALSFKQFDNGTVLIGGGVRGTAFPDDNRTRLDMAGVASFLKTARDVFPIMQGARIVRAWAGIEAKMKDDIPVFGPSSRHKGLYHQFGFSLHGFQLGPGAGAVMAELIVNGGTQTRISDLGIDRFHPSTL